MRKRLSAFIFVMAFGGCGAEADAPSKASLEQPFVLPEVIQGIPSRVAVGYQHTLEVGPNGTIWSWGDNSYGQLGLGNIEPRRYPTRISTLPYIHAVAAGEHHSLAIDEEGRVWAWGRNDKGQLAEPPDPRSPARTFPALISIPGQKSLPGERIIAVAAGATHSLALREDGVLFAWGGNDYGQLGNGSTMDSSTPIEVLLPAGCKPRSISAGSYHSVVACSSDGSVYAWGLGASGQVGNGTWSWVNTIPTHVSIPEDVFKVVAGGSHTLALTRGSVFAWGDNSWGQLGDGTQTSSNTPIEVARSWGMTDVAAGAQHSMYIDRMGTLVTFGRNDKGQLGRGFQSQWLPPGNANLSGEAIGGLSAGGSSSFARTFDGKLFGWGGNDVGQLGDDTTIDRFSPVRLTSYLLAAGRDHTLLRSPDAKIWSWGKNDQGQLGDGTTAPTERPVRVATLEDESVVALAAGDSHSLALTASGEVWGWGSNARGQLGSATPANRPIPAKINIPAQYLPIVAIAAGAEHSVAIGANGTVLTWGNNTERELGRNPGTPSDPTPQPLAPPLTLPLPQSYLQVSSKGRHTVIISGGVMFSWGANGRGQLGVGHSNPVNGYQSVVWSIIDPPLHVAVGGEHSVVTTGKRGVSWGANGYGQLGEGTMFDRDAPVDLASQIYVLKTASGLHHSFAIDEEYRLWLWGRNDEGQLGLRANFVDQETPVRPGGKGGLPLSEIVAAAGGACHSVVVRHDGTILSWGCNSDGQRGIPSGVGPLDPTTPAPVYLHHRFNPSKQVVVGETHSFYLGPTETLAWGLNGAGQLGDGSDIDRICPVEVDNGPFSHIAAGSGFSLGISSHAWGWGSREAGQLGFPGGNDLSFVPLPVPHLVVMAAAEGHALGLDGFGRLWSWGKNNLGERGLGSVDWPPERPSLVPFIRHAISIAAGDYFSLAVAEDNSVWGWGTNNAGQLAEAVALNSFAAKPVRIPGLQNIVRVVTSPKANFALALDDTGHVWSWGDNTHGQRGYDMGVFYPEPRQVPDLDNVVDIGVGATIAVAVRSDGTVWYWGDGASPKEIEYPCHVVQADAGVRHIVALCDDGTLWGWGDPTFAGTRFAGTVPAEILKNGHGCP